MGRAPCCDKANVKKGPWSPEEDAKLKEFIDKHGTGGNWIALPQKVGLKRCGKSCRLRWLNYLRPNIKHGEFSDEEDRVIINLFANIGSRWSIIAAQLPGRTDNDIKNYWNTKLKKKLMAIIGNNNNNNNNNQPTQLRRLSHHNIASSTNNNNISYDLLQPKSSSSPPSSSYTCQHFEPNILSSCSYMNMNMNMNIQMAPQERLTSFMMLGQSYGDQTSCSSSDGTKTTSYDDSMVSNGIVNLNSVNSTWGSSSSPTNYQSNDGNNNNNNNTNPLLLDYGLEEIKQLISSTNSTTSSSCGNNFLYDENKTEQERLLYHYY